jgi:hypothetical protein
MGCVPTHLPPALSVALVKNMEEKKNMQNITIIAQTRHVELDGIATPGHTIAAADEYIVPVDPEDETQ